MRLRPSVALIHHGQFSGCTASLHGALAARMSVVDLDLLRLARFPGLLRARVRAAWEAQRTGRGTPWVKTGTWSRACQQWAEEHGFLAPHRPVLFLQTLSAFALDAAGPRYAVYTDRVSAEGASRDGIYASRFTPAWRARERVFLQRAERVFVMGPATRDVLEQEYGVPGWRVSVVGGGPNVPLSGPLRADRCRALLFVGREWEMKGGPLVVRAFQQLRRQFPDLELLIVGCRPFVRPPAGVRVLGWVPREGMDDVYSAAQVLVVPGYKEAFGHAFVEGLIKGLPCVATCGGNQADLLADAGRCVPPGDVEALRAALAEVIVRYPEYRRRAVRRGGELQERFAWDRIAGRILAEFLEVTWAPGEDPACPTPGRC